VHPHAVGERAVPADDRVALLGAEIFLPTGAPLAMPARSALPPHAHALTDRHVLHIGPHGGDGADRLVTSDKRELRKAPVVVDEGEVAVADAAVRHLHLDLLSAERTGVIIERFQLLLRTFGGVGVNRGHDR
jgi:hypothetical protein